MYVKNDRESEDYFFQVALNLVKQAGQLVKDAFEKHSSNVITKSSDTDLVTETDQAVEDLLIQGLSREFSNHKFIGEESAIDGRKLVLTDSPTWVIDPIDGTTNFVHGVPLIGICVALLIKKKLRAGIVYNPINGDLFTAQRGKGAFKNGFPIRVSNTESLNKSIICATLGEPNLSLMGEKYLNVASENLKKVVLSGSRGLRNFGCCSMNIVYVAQGSVDAYIEYGPRIWDIAAGAIIAKEAGGHVIDPEGGSFNLLSHRILIAGTEKLAKEINQLLEHTDFEHDGDALYYE